MATKTRVYDHLLLVFWFGELKEEYFLRGVVRLGQKGRVRQSLTEDKSYTLARRKVTRLFESS